MSVAVICLPGAALCVSRDGHVAVEVADGSCGSSPRETATAAPAGEASAHGCVDTALGTPAVKTATFDAALAAQAGAFAVSVIGASASTSSTTPDDALHRPGAGPRALSPILIL
ncbi:MAG TPA: hypothetical protein VFD92_17700 [Candidatus Binatia bacterium]|nr:hypothetical protein [Candidatus Binatia bacterium]